MKAMKVDEVLMKVDEGDEVLMKVDEVLMKF